MPWVTETRLAPGQKRKRNPTWGILAMVGGVINAGLFLVGLAVMLTLPQAFGWVLPLWGIVTLAALGCSIAAIVKRGGFNVTMGWLSLGVVVLTNPLIPLVAITFLGSLAS